MFDELTWILHADESAAANHDREGQAAHRQYKSCTVGAFAAMDNDTHNRQRFSS